MNDNTARKGTDMLLIERGATVIEGGHPLGFFLQSLNPFKRCEQISPDCALGLIIGFKSPRQTKNLSPQSEQVTIRFSWLAEHLTELVFAVGEQVARVVNIKGGDRIKTKKTFSAGFHRVAR